MDKKEKKLIEELFKRLYTAEKKSSIRDGEAELFIKNCYKNQKSSLYYMTQTILVQEVAIKKLNQVINQLEEKIKNFSNKNVKKNFLSGLLDKYLPSEKNEDVSSGKNPKINTSSYNINKNMESLHPINNSSNSGNSFLGNALQTAAGVAGGIVAGNMLMNLFSKNRPEEEILNTTMNNNYFPSEESSEFHDHMNVNNSEISESSVIEKTVDHDFGYSSDSSLDNKNIVSDNSFNENNFLEKNNSQAINNENIIDENNFFEKNNYQEMNNEGILDNSDDDDF